MTGKIRLKTMKTPKKHGKTARKSRQKLPQIKTFDAEKLYENLRKHVLLTRKQPVYAELLTFLHHRVEHVRVSEMYFRLDGKLSLSLHCSIHAKPGKVMPHG